MHVDLLAFELYSVSFVLSLKLFFPISRLVFLPVIVSAMACWTWPVALFDGTRPVVLVALLLVF